MIKIFIVVLFVLVTIGIVVSSSPNSVFPEDFLFGYASASYQVEGAYDKDGKKPNIWDVFSHIPGKVEGNGNGDVADLFYYLYAEDVMMMKKQGVKSFRFSISWARVIDKNGVVNEKGIEFYDKLINLLLANDIEPFATLYHWDLPLDVSSMQKDNPKYKGWINETIVEQYTLYADTCFQRFGDRVKKWLTFNEPLTFCLLGYLDGIHAPGRCSDRSKCREGDDSVEPYLCSHNVLLSHANTVKLYREKYQSIQKGLIGITLNSAWCLPYDESDERDVKAAQRSLDFSLGWYADPVFLTGDYPESMKYYAKGRIPVFTEEQKKMLKGSSDFFGLNHYTSVYVKHVEENNNQYKNYYSDIHVQNTAIRNGVPIGEKADSSWLYVYPDGMKQLLLYIQKRYNNADIYITENGVDCPNESKIPLPQVLNDTFRIDYLKGYLGKMEEAMEESNVKVKGYFAWSVLDNFEWADSYEKRFGLNYVDYKDNLKRYPKESSKWYTSYIHSKKP